MSGPRFLQELRKHAHGPAGSLSPVFPDSELMSQASQFAPVMMLAKPLERELLERTVRLALGRRKAVGDP